MTKPRIYHDRSDSVVEIFKQYSEAANKQLEHTWFPDEIRVQKDKQNILVECTEQERHGILTTLKLFTLYELKAGSEWWGDRFIKIFKGPEFKRMASVFSMFELAVHKPFYSKINEVLGLDKDEFYSSYVDDPDLKSRMEFVDTVINHDSDLVASAAFTFVEGAILYSAFAFLKHFSAQGKNKINNIVRGINFSLGDEGLHATAGAMAFRQLWKEMIEDGRLSKEEQEDVKRIIFELAHKVYEHEEFIINKIFEKGSIPGITELQMKNFMKNRLNECCKEIGFEKIWAITYDPIDDWFYKNITSYNFNDFFAGGGAEYTRNWDEERFIWKKREGV